MANFGQFWCSLANALQAARCVRIKPTNGRRELNSLLWSRFLTVLSEICTPVPRHKSLCRERTVLRLNRLADKSEIPVLLMCCGPSAPLSSSPRVLLSLSKSPPSTRDNTWGYPQPSCINSSPLESIHLSLFRYYFGLQCYCGLVSNIFHGYFVPKIDVHKYYII